MTWAEEQLVMTRDIRAGEIIASLGPDAIQFDGTSHVDPRRKYLLIERNWRGARRHWLSSWDTPEGAGRNVVEQEYAEEWETIALVDLDTGLRFTVNVSVNWVPQPAVSGASLREPAVTVEPEIPGRTERVSEAEVAERIADAQDRALIGQATDDGTMPLWYLSFTDPEIAATIPEGEERPGGPSWLGACIVPALDGAAVVGTAHLLGCNPGGQVTIAGPIPRDEVKPEYVGRLLTTPAECEEAGA